ncbi:NrfD/PsrC family molybdoenzyme membrane anchor subunit [Thauera humireducens]|uniref:NrfD/PsrC family molybdoenzyme membrane anchor subunit n=1 Tax=Thauera humireducens TaxID=1134435 RepID=UPI00311FD87F
MGGAVLLPHRPVLRRLPAVAAGRRLPPSGWAGTSRLALLGALVCGLAAPVALLADLHQPGRFWHFYAYFTPTSWMSWGAFFIPVYLVGLLTYAWLALRPDLAPCRRRRQAGRCGRPARLWRA